MTTSEIMHRLGEFGLALNPEQQQEVADALMLRTYKKNEHIYCAGDTPTHMLCLLDGKVKIAKEGVTDRPQIVRVLRPVSYFGYRASFAGQRFSTAAIALENCEIGMIPLRLVVGLMHENSQLSMFFIRQLSRYLGLADERTISLTQKHVRGRLAETLLFLRDSYGVDADGCTLSVALARQDIANLSNMTTSNAIRTLSAFASEGIIATARRKIRLLDIAALQDISNRG